MNGSMRIGIGNALFPKWVDKKEEVIMIQISEEWMDKLIEMVKQGNEVHLEFTPEETRIEVMPWKPITYDCPFKRGDKDETN